MFRSVALCAALVGFLVGCDSDEVPIDEISVEVKIVRVLETQETEGILQSVRLVSELPVSRGARPQIQSMTPEEHCTLTVYEIAATEEGPPTIALFIPWRDPALCAGLRAGDRVIMVEEVTEYTLSNGQKFTPTLLKTVKKKP